MPLSLESHVKSNIGDVVKDIRTLRHEFVELAKAPTDLKISVNSRQATGAAKATFTAIDKEMAKSARQQVGLAAKADRDIAKERERTNRATSTALMREAGKTQRHELDLAQRTATERGRIELETNKGIERSRRALAVEELRQKNANARESARIEQRNQTEQNKAAERAAKERTRAAENATRDAARLAREESRERAAALRWFERENKASLRRQEKDAKDTARRIERETAKIQREQNRKIGAGKSASGDLANRGAAATDMAGAALFAGLALSTKAAIDWEDQFTGVEKTVDATASQFLRLNKELRHMATEIPVAAKDLAQIAENAGQLGIETKSIKDFTRVMADLSVATNLTADEASTDLAKFANIMKMPQTQFQRLGSTLVDLGNKGASTEKDIMAMGLRIAGAGKQIGLSEAQVLAFASSLSSVGIEAEAGGSAISTVFKKIDMAVRDGGKGLDAFAKVAGVSSAEFAKRFKTDAAGAIVSFVEGLARIQKEGGNVFGTLKKLELSEIRVNDALLRTAGNSAILSKSLKDGDQAWKDNNALTKEAETRYATMASQLRIASNQANEMAIIAGGSLAPSIVRVVGETKTAFIWFDKLGTKTQDNIIKFGLFAGAGLILIGRIKATIETVILLRTAFIGLSASITKAGGAAAIAGRVMTVAFGPVGLAIAALAATWWGVRTAILGTRDAGTMTADKLIEKWGTLGRIWVRAGDALGNIMSKLNGSTKRGDIATDGLLAIENDKRRRGIRGKNNTRPLTREEFQTSDPNASEYDGSHADGLERVPFDGYVAELHKNEAVLTADEADLWRTFTSAPGETYTIANARKSAKVSTLPSIPAPPTDYLAPMPVSSLKPRVSSQQYASRKNAIEDEIDKLQARIDNRVLARVGVKGKKADLQLTKWRIELRKLRDRKSDLGKLEAEARRNEKASAREAAKAPTDVSLRSLIPNLSLRDAANTNPQTLEVAMALAKIKRDGLTLSRKRPASQERQWKVADYTNSPKFTRDLAHAGIPGEKATDIKLRLLAEAQVLDVRKESKRLAIETARIQTRIAESVDSETIAQRNQIELVALENSLLSEGKLTQDEITAKVDEERIRRERIAELIEKGARPEQAESIANIESGKRGFMASIDKATERQREAREEARLSLDAIGEAMSQTTRLKTIVADASVSLKAALDDPTVSGAELLQVLNELPPAVLALEQAAKSAERSGDSSLFQKYGEFLALLKTTRKTATQASDFDKFETIFAPAREIAGATKTGIDDARREYDNRNLPESEKLRLQSVGELKALADSWQSNPLSPELARAASDEYRKISDDWKRIVQSQKDFEAKQSTDKINAQVKIWGDETRFAGIFDPVERELAQLKANLKADGWTDAELEIIVPARRAALKADDMSGRIQTALESAHGALSESFGRIKTDGLSAINGLFDGALNALNQFASQWLADQAWQQILGFATSLFGGSIGKGNSNFIGNGPGPWAGGYVNGSHADGLAKVPFDGYVAELHKDERVLTATEAGDYSEWKAALASTNEWARDSESGGGGTTIINNNHYYTIGSVRANNPEQFTAKMPGSNVPKATMKKKLNQAANDGGRFL